MYTTNAKIQHIFVSPGHNYWGNKNWQPGTHPTHDVEQVALRAGAGIVGDRYFNKKPNYSGQITFFAQEVLAYLREEMQLADLDPQGVRRNVITQGINLNQLIGKRFTLQGIEFEGVEHCRPCKWMNVGVAQNALPVMKGKGGLRARILLDGTLSVGDAELTTDSPQDLTKITAPRQFRLLP